MCLSAEQRAFVITIAQSVVATAFDQANHGCEQRLCVSLAP
jgi:hypothetical protein